MSYAEVVKQVKNKQIPSLVLLYGTESYFIQNIKQQIFKIVSSDYELEESVYDLEETPVQEVITDAETYPFFGDQKIIIANNPVFLKAKQDKLPFEHKLDVLEKYAINPVDHTIIIFIAPYEKIDDRKKISKLLKKEAMVAACAPIKENELLKWIKSLADQHKIVISNDAYEVFQLELSTDLYLLQNEITKLALFVGVNGTVTKEIAERLISHTTSHSSLRLVDAVIERDLNKAVSIYKDLEKMKEEPIALIALLAFQFRTIFQVKLLKGKGYSQSQMQKQLKAHPYVIKIAYNRERRFTDTLLRNIIDKLTIADTVMKHGKMEKSIAFELLLYELIQLR